MKRILTCAALISMSSTALSAQTEAAAAAAAEIPAPAAAPAVARDLVLRELTPIMLVVAEEVNSSTHREGDTFKLTVLNDISVGQTVVIPRGTPAEAIITWRTGKGAFGKSGKLEFSHSHILLDGKRIPVTGTFRQEGEGNTVATGVGIIAVGVFAGFITGKRARLPAGRELMSHGFQAVPFTADGKLANSFDSDAAMAAAARSTPFGICWSAANALTDEKKKKDAKEKCFVKRMD